MSGPMRLFHLGTMERAVLAERDDERLSDLGLSREDVARECAKSFWQ